MDEELKKQLSKALRRAFCEAAGHDFVPYKPGTMICSRCGIFAKVTATYMRTRDPDDLKVEGERKIRRKRYD